jgi:signal transduction histidine kinase
MPGQSIDNPQRLEALEETQLLDTLPDASFDRFTRLACAILGVETSVMSLVARDRQFFKSACDLGDAPPTNRSTALSHSFCHFVVESGEPLVIENAHEDPRVSSHPATLELGICAYLGMPIITQDGYVLGTLCAVSDRPRHWTDADQQNLSDLTVMLSRKIDLTQQNTALHRTLWQSENSHHDLECDLRSVAHDLRTPTSTISSSVELITSSKDPLSDECRELLQACQESSQSMLHLIEQITLGRHHGPDLPDHLHIKPISASLLLRRITLVLTPLASQANILLDLQWPESLIQLHVDERLIERVFLNLLAHAVESSPPGGTVKIRLRITYAAGYPMCYVYFTDQGSSLSDAEKQRLFDESYTDHLPSGRGLTTFGIGLAFCKKVVEAHDGQIGIETPAEAGNAFFCLLPCSIS